jgi:peptidoglycan/xylan/chitin deacetylase (PgdA/CDA1 family)
VLDVLKHEGVPATFFVVGERVEMYPEIVRRIVAEGHTLGHHSFFHADPARTSAKQLIDEVKQTSAALVRIVREAPRLCRPPHGKLTVAKLLSLWSNGQTVVLWNIDPADFACQTEEELRAWFRARPLQGGDVVLLHDNRPYAPGALSEVIQVARRDGLNFSTPQEWLGRSAHAVTAAPGPLT